jgi:hypothetical protein
VSGAEREGKAKAEETKNDDRLFALISGALADPVSFAIIKSTIREALTAIEIARRNRIPVSSVYKKIRKLQDFGMVCVDKIDIDSRSGKKIAYYKSRIRTLELRLSDDGMASCRMETRPSDSRLGSIWANADLFLARSLNG